MRKHLSGMRSLSLTSKQNWQGASKLWSELAQLTQLTELNLEFTDEVSHTTGGLQLPGTVCLSAVKQTHV